MKLIFSKCTFKISFQILKVLIIVFFVFILTKDINFVQFKFILSKVNYSPIIICFTILWPLNILILSIRQKICLNTYKINIEVSYLVKHIYIGSLINNFLPAGLGNDISKYYSINRSLNLHGNHQLKNAIILDKLVGLISILLFCIVLGINILVFQKFNFVILLLEFISFTAIFILVGLYLTKFNIPSIKNLFINKLIIQINDFINVKPKLGVLLKAIILSSFLILLANIAYYMLNISVNGGISFLLINLFMPFVSLADIVPISINSIGVREYVVNFFLLDYNIKKEEILVIMLLARVLSLMFSLPAIILILLDKKNNG